VKSYLPGFSVKADCLPVAKLLKKSGPLSGRSVQGDWVGEVVLCHSCKGVKSLAIQLPPLPSLEVAPFSTAAASTDFLLLL
jgi:hypothetical protein